VNNIIFFLINNYITIMLIYTFLYILSIALIVVGAVLLAFDDKETKNDILIRETKYYKSGLPILISGIVILVGTIVVQAVLSRLRS